jgi:LacI family transcriptional regulator
MKKESSKELSGVKEIARRANVSIATVDRVLHNRTGVSPKTKALIESIIKELNYQPNLLARNLALKNQLNFAVLLPSVSKETDFWNAPLKGIQLAESEIHQYGVKVTSYFFDLEDKSSFVKQSKQILKSQPDGIVLAPSFVEESREFIKQCKKKNIPYVFINSDIPEQESLCYIGPELYRSGYQGAHLVSYITKKNDKILVVNISREIDSHHHLLRKEEGFRAYFTENKLHNPIVRLDIHHTDYASVKKELLAMLKKHKDIRSLFVTNSRVVTVAEVLEKHEIKDLMLVGYDLVAGNADYLKKQLISFLICQRPQEQGYRGIMTLYNQLMLGTAPLEKYYYMPIDIVTPENYEFYRN